MYTPSNITFFGSFIPVAGGVDITLNTLLGVSWAVLLPYTLLGIGLMTYSQIRLLHGQHQLKHDQDGNREA